MDFFPKINKRDGGGGVLSDDMGLSNAKLFVCEISLLNISYSA